MSHGNARTTIHGRKLIVARHLAGWRKAHIRKAHIAAAMGISRKCVRTWITRFEVEVEAGLVERSSRPHTSRPAPRPRSRTASSNCAGRERKGPDWLGAELGVPARTVSRVLAAAGSHACARWTL